MAGGAAGVHGVGLIGVVLAVGPTVVDPIEGDGIGAVGAVVHRHLVRAVAAILDAVHELRGGDGRSIVAGDLAHVFAHVVNGLVFTAPAIVIAVVDMLHRDYLAVIAGELVLVVRVVIGLILVVLAVVHAVVYRRQRDGLARVGALEGGGLALRDRVVGRLVVTSGAVVHAVVDRGQRNDVARRAIEGRNFLLHHVGFIITIGTIIAAVVGVRQGDLDAVVTDEDREFLEVVRRLVGTVLAVCIAVIDVVKGHEFAVVTGVIRGDDVIGFIITIGTIIAAVVEKGEADRRAVLAGVGHGAGAVVFVGRAVAIFDAIVHERPWPGEVLSSDLAVASKDPLVFGLIVFFSKPILGVVHDLIIMVHAVDGSVVDPGQRDDVEGFVVPVVVAREGAVLVTVEVVGHLVFAVRAIVHSVVDQ